MVLACHNILLKFLIELLGGQLSTTYAILKKKISEKKFASTKNNILKKLIKSKKKTMKTLCYYNR